MPGRVNFQGNSDISGAGALDHSDDESSVISGTESVSGSDNESVRSESVYTSSEEASSLDNSNLSARVFPKFSFFFPKFSFFGESFSLSNHPDVAEKKVEAERWNDQIDQTIAQLKKKPQLGAPPSLNVQPDQADSGQPHLNVNVPSASTGQPDVDEAAAEQLPQNLDFEAISGLFNTDTFPNFEHKIELVRRTLSSDGTSLADKIATLLSLKEKTDLFGGTVFMINLAEALRDTARSGADYKVADQTAEIEAEKNTEREAIENAEKALNKCQAEYEQQNGLLQDLLDLKNPVTDVTLRALYERYLDISQDDENTTPFEAFTNALFDENNQYLNSLNDLVAASRQKVIDAHKELDKVKALQHSEIEYRIFRRSPQSGLGNWFQTNTFVNTFTFLNRSLPIEQIGNFFDSIRSSLLDADQNKFMRGLVITVLFATTFFYFVAKIVQTTGAFCLALVVTGVAALAHALFQIGLFVGEVKSKTYDVPKDEDQANKTRIADSNRKLVIAAHFATNPRNLAVKRVALSSILAPIPRRKGVKVRKKPVEIKRLRPLGSMRQVTNLRPNHHASALLEDHFLQNPSYMERRSDSPNAQSGSRAFQLSPSQVLGSSSSQSAYVPPMLADNEGDIMDDPNNSLKEAFRVDRNGNPMDDPISIQTDYRAGDSQFRRERKGKQANPSELGSGVISHCISQNATNGRLSIAQSRVYFARGAQQQTIDSLEQKINSQGSNSELIRGMSTDELRQSYGNIRSSRQVLDSSSAQVANVQQSWHSRFVNFISGHKNKTRFSHNVTYQPNDPRLENFRHTTAARPRS